MVIKKRFKKEEIKQNREDLEDLVSYIRDFNFFLPIAVCSISPNRNITDINRALEELTGYKLLEITGRSVETLFLERNKIENIINKAAENKIVRNKKLTLICKEQKKIPVDISISARKDKEGNLIGFFVSIIDITEIKKLQDLLEKQVEERTAELKNKIKELEKFQKITVGRELKMIELKKEIERLKNRASSSGGGGKSEEKDKSPLLLLENQRDK